MEMDRHRRKQTAIMKQQQSSYSEEVSSKEWKFISMSEQEEDIINRMYKLVGPRVLAMKEMFTWIWKWSLIAGRVPGRKPEEIERFWMMQQW